MGCYITLRNCEEGNMAEQGQKYDTGKLRYDLLPPKALEHLVKIYTDGSMKYAPRNWEKGMSWGRIFAAVMRHLWAFWAGETYDKDSGCLHVAHAAWGCLALVEYVLNKAGIDDRPYAAT